MFGRVEIGRLGLVSVAHLFVEHFFFVVLELLEEQLLLLNGMDFLQNRLFFVEGPTGRGPFVFQGIDHLLHVCQGFLRLFGDFPK